MTKCYDGTFKLMTQKFKAVAFLLGGAIPSRAPSKKQRITTHARPSQSRGGNAFPALRPSAPEPLQQRPEPERPSPAGAARTHPRRSEPPAGPGGGQKVAEKLCAKEPRSPLPPGWGRSGRPRGERPGAGAGGRGLALSRAPPPPSRPPLPRGGGDGAAAGCSPARPRRRGWEKEGEREGSGAPPAPPGAAATRGGKGGRRGREEGRGAGGGSRALRCVRGAGAWRREEETPRPYGRALRRAPPAPPPQRSASPPLPAGARVRRDTKLPARSEAAGRSRADPSSAAPRTEPTWWRQRQRGVEGRRGAAPDRGLSGRVAQSPAAAFLLDAGQVCGFSSELFRLPWERCGEITLQPRSRGCPGLVCYGFESDRYIPLVSVPEVSVACLKKKSWVCVKMGFKMKVLQMQL